MGCRNGGRRHEPLTGVGYGTGPNGVSMFLRDDGAVFHVTGLLRTDGRYLCANGLHAVAVTLCTRQIVQHRVSLVLVRYPGRAYSHGAAGQSQSVRSLVWRAFSLQSLASGQTRALYLLASKPLLTRLGLRRLAGELFVRRWPTADMFVSRIGRLGSAHHLSSRCKNSCHSPI